MEQYLSNLPYFIIWASVGIIASLWYGRDRNFPMSRILKEIFGGLWVSSVVYIFIDQLTSCSDVLLYVITSLIAFVNSRLITILNKDVMDGLAENSKRAMRNLADRLKKDNSYDYEQEERPPFDPDGQ